MSRGSSPTQSHRVPEQFPSVLLRGFLRHVGQRDYSDTVPTMIDHWKSSNFPLIKQFVALRNICFWGDGDGW